MVDVEHATKEQVYDLQWQTPIPRAPHVTLPATALKEKIILVGDIHGCVEEFRQLLQKCGYDSATCTLIILGDLVNKGPHSQEVVEYVRSLGAYCVRGNHDDTALSYVVGINAGKPKGKYEFLNSFSSADIEWLKELPYTISIPSLAILIVHAGLVPGVPLYRQTRINMITMRNVIEHANCEGGDRWTGTDKGDQGEPWAKVWSEGHYLRTEDGKPYHVYFGHAAKNGLQNCEYATGLDSGCVYGKQLSAIILPTNELVQVDAGRVYQEPGRG